MSVAVRTKLRLAPDSRSSAVRYPAIELDLHLDDAVSDMIGGRYDVGIRAGEARDGFMIVREIAPLSFVVCGAPAYFAEHGIPQSAADLSQHNCLRLRARGGVPRKLSNGAWVQRGAWILSPSAAISSGMISRPWSRRPCTRSGIGLCSPSSGSSVVPNGCPETGFAGMRIAAGPDLNRSSAASICLPG